MSTTKRRVKKKKMAKASKLTGRQKFATGLLLLLGVVTITGLGLVVVASN